MSLTTDGVWKANVWASTVWDDCVWWEPACVIVATVVRNGSMLAAQNVRRSMRRGRGRR